MLGDRKLSASERKMNHTTPQRFRNAAKQILHREIIQKTPITIN